MAQIGKSLNSRASHGARGLKLNGRLLHAEYLRSRAARGLKRSLIPLAILWLLSRAARRALDLQAALSARVRELEAAQEEVRELKLQLPL